MAEAGAGSGGAAGAAGGAAAGAGAAGAAGAGTGAGAAGGAAGAAGNGTGQAGAGQAGNGAAGGAGDAGAAAAAAATAGYRPAGIPDHLAGASDKETIDKLFKAVDGFRTSQAQRGEMPADAKGYDFQPSDVVKPYAAGLGNDPFMGKVQEFAFKAGIPKGQFQTFLNDVLGEMVAGQMVDPPFNPDTERAALAPNVADPTERAAAADRMSREAIARVDAWKAQGLPEPIAKDLLSRMDRATTVQLVNWIASGRRETMPAMGGVQAGSVTEAQLRERMADPRQQVGNAKFDRAFATETDRLFKAMYPGGAER